MSETVIYVTIILVSIIATALGYTLAALRTRNQIDALKQKYADLNARLDAQRNDASEKLSSVAKVREGIENTLISLSSELNQTDIPADKSEFVQNLLQPLQRALLSADQQVKHIAAEDKKIRDLIQQQLTLLKQPQQLGRGNLRDIARTLGDENMRNTWGITTIKQLLELTHSTPYCEKCCVISNEDGEDEGTPPCLISLPDGQKIAIDTNSPLEPYMSICQAPDATVRSWHMETHARKLRERIMTMSSHIYASQFKEVPASQILMIFNDHYLSTALEIDDDLLQVAANQNIVLATPTDVMTLMQTIAFAWQQQRFSSDAQKIRETGVHLYKRFGTFIKLIAELGSELSNVLNSYNRAVSYFESSNKEESFDIDPLAPENPTEENHDSTRNQKSA